jgi:hypothetical protein
MKTESLSSTIKSLFKDDRTEAEKILDEVDVEMVADHMRAYDSNSYIDKAWIDGIRKGMKKVLKAPVLKTPEDGVKYVETVKQYIKVLKEELLFNKGFAPYPSDVKWFNSLSKNKQKEVGKSIEQRILEILREAESIANGLSGNIRFYMDALDDNGTGVYAQTWDAIQKAAMRKFGSYDRDAMDDAVVSWMQVDIKEQVNKITWELSSKLLGNALTKHLSQYKDGGDVGLVKLMVDPIDREISLGKVKLIFQDFSQGRDNERRAQASKNYVAPMKKAWKLLKDKKLDKKLWYGNIFIQPEDWGGENPYGKELGVGGHYDIGADVIRVFSDPSDWTAELMVHELGHRYYYRVLSGKMRRRFEAEFGEVPAVSDYGSKSASEKFAEIFAWYLLGRDLTREQLREFKYIIFGKRFEDVKEIDELLLLIGSSNGNTKRQPQRYDRQNQN